MQQFEVGTMVKHATLARQMNHALGSVEVAGEKLLFTNATLMVSIVESKYFHLGYVM